MLVKYRIKSRLQLNSYWYWFILVQFDNIARLVEVGLKLTLNSAILLS